MSRRHDYLGQADEHNARGIELADRGWLDEAASEFTKAIKLDPKSAHAHDNLATVLSEKGQLLDALFEFVEAIKNEPDCAAAHHYLACFLSAQGPELAIAEYRHALEIEDDLPDAHFNLALALAERGQVTEAIHELEIAHAQAPEDETVEHELACCLIDLERYLEAINHLKKIIKLHPEHVEAYVDLGIAYTAQGFYAEAESTFRKSIEIDSADLASHYHLAGLYAVWGKEEESLKHLAIAARQDGDKVRLWLKDDHLFDSVRDYPDFLKIIP